MRLLLTEGNQERMSVKRHLFEGDNEFSFKHEKLKLSTVFHPVIVPLCNTLERAAKVS